MAYGDSEVSEQETSQGEPDTKLDLLALCREEMRRAIGFEQDADLLADRERALNYRKGDVSADIPSLPNRSKAVDSTLSDAIETLKPDIVEIFVGGDDVVAFLPQKQSDVEAAKQETAYLHHVVFQDNPGFLNFTTAIDDALTLKTGVFHWEWEEEINEQEEEFTGKNAVELHLAAQDGEVVNVKAEQEGLDLRQGTQTYSFTVRKTLDTSRAKYWAVAPDDFAAAPDTVNIAETTYCCERQRPRVQDLIALGFDEEKARNLEAYSYSSDQTIQLARDTAGETNSEGSASDDTSEDLRQVEIRKHCIRVLGDDKKLELWCVYTDSQATVELHREEIDSIPYAVGSPYLVAHRLIGRSLGDMLIEVMKQKTVILRMLLDCGYFALNQRNEVAMDQANDFTISDLLRNEPSVPVRSKTGNAVRPLTTGPLNFDPFKAYEFLASVAESRTGVFRNAQAMNPDALHETAKGAMLQLSSFQKRTRFIARVIAETLIKPLFLGVHGCIRQNSKAVKEAQLLGKWVPVDPTKWAERTSMTVEVGLGAAGKDAEIAAMNTIHGMQKAIVEGGGGGTLVTPENIYKSATDMAKKLGVKQPEEYFTDPNTPEAQAAMQAKAQQPNPDVMKIQAETQLQQAKQQGEAQLGMLKVQSEKEIQANKSQYQAAADQHKQQLEHERELQKHADMMQLEGLKIASEERIAIETARIKAEAQIESARIAAKASDGATELARQEAHETA